VSALTLSVPTAEAVRDLGRRLGRVAEPGDRFMLEGPFGAGKTTFVQGLAQGLDVRTPVGSPSFVIETQYTGRLVLYHVDLYRLDHLEPELLEELEEHLYGAGVTAVEWAERLPPELRDGAIQVRFRMDGDVRVLEVMATQERFANAVKQTT
jgi:tRNA threonylcarbamoyladenosine biosynthesis protein TsaE